MLKTTFNTSNIGIIMLQNSANQQLNIKINYFYIFITINLLSAVFVWFVMSKKNTLSTNNNKYNCFCVSNVPTSLK